MKIALPVENKSMDANISNTFGRTPYLLIYNTLTKESMFLDHRAAVSKGAAGIRASEVVADNGVKALLTSTCGENTHKILNNAEVLIYKSRPGTIKQNIDAFMSDQLSLLTEFQEGHQDKEES